jgi:hypothetical protein
MAHSRCVAEHCRAETGRAAAWAGAARGSRICPDCRRRLTAAVERLPGLYDDSEDMLTGPRRSGSERVRGSRPGDLSLDSGVMAARSAMLGVTSSWAGFIADRRAVENRPRRSVPDLARFLLHHLDWLVRQDAARDAFNELTAVTRSAEDAIDPGRRDRIEIGPCDRPQCEGTVYAMPPEVGCDRGHRWSPSEWLLLSRRLGAAAR